MSIPTREYLLADLVCFLVASEQCWVTFWELGFIVYICSLFRWLKVAMESFWEKPSLSRVRDLVAVALHRSWKKHSLLIHSAEILLHAHVWWSVPRPRSIQCYHALPFPMLPHSTCWLRRFPGLSLIDMLMFNMDRSANRHFILLSVA